MAHKRLTTEDFVSRSRSIHGNRYDYSEVEYVNNSTKVRIICREHGGFPQVPMSHFSGSGCPRCHNMRGASTQDWIGKFRIIHGDRYDYSKTKMTRASDKITIICRKHGEFRMTPGNHSHKTRPQNCPKCMGVHRYNTAEFIERSKEKFGEKFDYSKVEYNTATTPTTIICDVHGEIKISPIFHLKSPTGCERCSSEQTGLSQRRSQTEIIEAFIARHGDRYDYSKVEYKGDKHNVLIICRDHGEFWQRAVAHANGRNCNDCMNIEAGLTRRLSREEVISRAIEVHGTKYDYSKVEFDTIGDRITIICPEHGEFQQVVTNHINQGNGCRKCALIDGGLKRRITNEDWISRFKKVHGDTYDYSNFDSNGASNKANIICYEHGIFPQAPSVHSNGHGCPKCLKKNQTSVYEFLCELFPNEKVYFDFQHPELRFSKSNAKMQLDIWIPGISLAVEYQGEQHFETFWRGVVELSETQTLESTKIRDEEKRRACGEKGIVLVEIPYTWDRTLDYVRNTIVGAGIEL